MQKGRMLNRKRWIGIILALVIAGLPMTLLLLVLDNDDYAAADDGESYKGRIYKRSDGAIYAAVPSNVYYRIDEADPASFKAFYTPTYDCRNAARDSRHVYCGNLILPGLKPTSTQFL